MLGSQIIFELVIEISDKQGYLENICGIESSFEFSELELIERSIAIPKDPPISRINDTNVVVMIRICLEETTCTETTIGLMHSPRPNPTNIG
ncbi:hypothetical protein AYI70_g5837 [Smittium culicis]|uniref:Uncharacterized protein n=1 Tax=Smittium culicis TaxID=133412 RepID=A0A1R1XSM4_9FUNG|nr:hypothetical protein AYI70_g5837 [Smittium culicis]